MRYGITVGMLLVASIAAAGEAASDHRLVEELADGEAYIWYLGHAGWLVRTSEHLLVFDYTGPIDNGALDRGTLSPDVLAGRTAILFVSHAHGDHFKPHVLQLRRAAADRPGDVVIVMGWNEPDSGNVIVPPDGEWVDVSGATVFALHHEFDGIPEGFFLVRSGGVTVYHSGDHGTWSDPPNGAFRNNIDRLAGATERVDLAFISSFGDLRTRQGLNQGDIYSLRTIKPRVTFPMHGHEDDYAIFASQVSSLGLPTEVAVARTRGASFHYSKSVLTSLDQAAK